MPDESTEEKKERYLQAISKIKEKGYTIAKASKEFGTRYRGSTKTLKKLENYTGGRHKALIQDQEKELLDFCMDLNSKYLVVTPSLVRSKAAKIAEKTKI